VTQQSKPLGDIYPSGLIDELIELTDRRKELLDGVREATESEEAAKARAKAKRVNVTEPLLAELKSLDKRLVLLLVARRRYFWNKSGKVITLPNAVIRYMTVAKSLDTPKDTSKIVDYLLRMRGGRRYLTFTPSLNRDAITNAGASIHTRLKPLGAWVGKHAIITIKTAGEDEPTTLDRRRFPGRHY
jgi:hypothetical protein